jgi:hypothetical protein
VRVVLAPVRRRRRCRRTRRGAARRGGHAQPCPPRAAGPIDCGQRPGALPERRVSHSLVCCVRHVRAERCDTLRPAPVHAVSRGAAGSILSRTSTTSGTRSARSLSSLPARLGCPSGPHTPSGSVLAARARRSCRAALHPPASQLGSK